jgi:outer membrane protein OmpU
MKKILLGTTALVAVLAFAGSANAQQAPLTITLGGSVKVNAGLVDENQDKNLRGNALYSDSDLTVRVDGKTANDVKYGARIRLQNQTADTNNAERYMIYASGDLGRIEGGNFNGAADRMAYYAPNKFGTGGIDGDYKTFVANNVSATSTAGAGLIDGRTSIAGLTEMFKAFDTNYATKVTYFSPRFSGFQFGASFSPDTTGDTTSAAARSEKINFAVTAANQGLLTRNDFQNAYELGLNYVSEYEGVSVAAGVTYVGAEAKEDINNVARFEDLASVQVGGQLGYQGWTLGGGYVDQGKSGYRKGTGLSGDGATGYNVGLQYQTGPFIIGTNALFAENEGLQSVTRNNELNLYSAGVTYVVAPGLSTYVEGSFFEYTTSSNAAGTGVGTARDDNDGTVIILGSKLEF